eukprot:CAMPEP_0180302896 /NCGR_PEP_ID=MMETSP0988-20121125/24609_1 /TAXON_ID=697907 /ORGANISM="non described non described, Strain CCMP2293" /LENGTH=524 /DNA_ID=CAMNT_0022284237 /DNA_START=27 /DNA_END=1597 /DNA_ORIENTATION=+
MTHRVFPKSPQISVVDAGTPEDTPTTPSRQPSCETPSDVEVAGKVLRYSLVAFAIQILLWAVQRLALSLAYRYVNHIPEEKHRRAYWILHAFPIALGIVPLALGVKGFRSPSFSENAYVQTFVEAWMLIVPVVMSNLVIADEMRIVSIWAFTPIMLQCSRAQLPWRKFIASIVFYVSSVLLQEVFGTGLGIVDWSIFSSHQAFASTRELTSVWECLPYAVALLFTSGGLITPIAITVHSNGKELARKRQVLQEVLGELSLEKTLLAALVPADIVARLLNGEALIADTHDNATVLFVYLEECDAMVERFGVSRTVEWINAVYSAFDAVVGGAPALTKLESFSNFYMVVSFGSDAPTSDTAAECLLAAVAMLQAVCVLPRPDGCVTTLRLGINTGAVCAGVIGSNLGSPRYSVFGDTVNTASRMASSGGASSWGNPFIHMTQATADQLLRPEAGSNPALLSLRAEFRLILTQQPGLTGIKGKGPMSTYALRAAEDSLPPPETEVQEPHRDPSLIRQRPPLGPYSRP